VNPSANSALSNYVAILRRRRRIVVGIALAIPLLALALSLQEQKLYQARSQVLIERQSLTRELTNTQDQTPAEDFARVSQTQASLARSPEVARRVLDRLGFRDRAPQGLLSRSSVISEPTTDLLDFETRDPSPAVAQRLANAYAAVFADYRRELDTASIKRARADIGSRIVDLNSRPGPKDSGLLQNLRSKDEQLRTLEALQTSNAAVVRRADGAGVAQPRTLRNVVLGLLVGVGLAVGVALLVDTLDTRLRHAEEVDEILQVPLLGRLPKPARRAREHELPVSLTNPRSDQAEAFRVLRTNLEFSAVAEPVESLAITSSVHAEGKSTTVSNLAVTLARAGRDVILVDLDLRRPKLATIFGLTDRPGITQLLLGYASLADAVSEIPLTNWGEKQASEPRGLSPASPQLGGGSLQIVTAGPVPPNVDELIGSKKLDEILRGLKRSGSIVLVDAPPLLGLGDTMTIGAKVDALMIVARLGTVRRPMLREMRRLLDITTTRVVGYVLANSGQDQNLGYGYGYGYGDKHESRSAPGNGRGTTSVGARSQTT
jgi:Mrp family chromosome partitioning ATPase/capsular polysaccharide biosynthesis protein